jgi:hypothetical protein
MSNQNATALTSWKTNELAAFVTNREIAHQISRDDLTFDQTELTTDQRREAERMLAKSIEALISENMARLASNALMYAREL